MRLRKALPELVAATRADSTFAGPLLYARVAHAVLGETAVVDAFLLIAERLRGRLTPTDRHLVDVWRPKAGAIGQAPCARPAKPPA